MLISVVQTRRLFPLVQKKKLERELVDAVFAIEDPTLRQNGFKALLGSKSYQEELTDEDVLKIFSLSQQQGGKELGTILREQPFFVERLTALGKYDAVRSVAANNMNRGSSALQQWSFYLNRAVVKRERSENRKPTLLVQLLKDRNPQTVESRLIELGRNKDAAIWVLDSYGWEPFGNALRRIEKPRRYSVVARMFQSTNLFAELAKLDRFEGMVKDGDLRNFITHEGGYVQLLRLHNADSLIDSKLLVELVRAGYEHSDPTHRRIAIRSMQNPALTNAALAAGQGEWLLKIFQANPPNSSAKEQREYRLKYLNSSRGLLWFAIRAEQFEQAEQMLSEFVDDDRGRLRLIRFQMHRQLIVESQGRELVLSDDFKTLLQNDKRLALYWARSQQDYETATAIAKDLADPGLVWSMAIESHDWKRLAELPVCRTSELPLRPANLKINPVHRRIEQLGFLTALKQIYTQPNTSNQQQQTQQQQTQQLRDWIEQNAATPNTPRYGADALLTVNEIDAAMRLLDDKHSRRAFYWHRFQLDYERALGVLGKDFKSADTIFDQMANQAIGTQQKRINAASYVIEVAMAIRDAGHDDDLQPIMDTLRKHADHPKLDGKTKAGYLSEVAKLLHMRGFPEESRKMIALTRDLTDGANALKRYFYFAYADPALSGAAAEAKVWLDEFRQRHPKETQLQLLNRVDGAMTATAEIETLRPFPEWDDDSTGSGVPVTRYRYKLYDEAIAIINKRSRKLPSDYKLIGQIRFAEQKYADAAAANHDAFTSSPGDLTRLYLAGHCWELAGDTVKANELKLRARALAVSFELNHGLAIGLFTAGLEEDAIEIYRTLVHNAPPSSTAHLQAVRHLAVHATDPKERVERWNEFTLYHLRPIEFYHDLHVWLRSETNLRVSRALLALEQDRLDEAREHFQQAVKINPADFWPVEQFAAALREKGKPKLADEIEKQRRDYLLGLQKRFPNSPVLKERLLEN